MFLARSSHRKNQAQAETQGIVRSTSIKTPLKSVTFIFTATDIMTRTLNTIPDEAAPLKAAKKSKSSNAKSILAAAATVSFIFGLNDILTATNETAIALANKGMDVRYVYGLDACHTDGALQLEQRVPALIWAMAPWKEKLAAKKSA